MLRCSNGHLIDKCKERLHTWQGVVHRHKRCALCGADIDRDDRRWRCAEHCDYNVCDRCYKHRITARAGRTRQEAATHGAKEPLLTDDAVGETRSVAAASSLPASCFDCFTSFFLGPSAGAAGVAFLERKAREPGVVKLHSGLLYKVLRRGEGKRSPAYDTQCFCHYTGRFVNGKVFDSSLPDRGEGPAVFAPKQLIRGWQEALQLMVEGDVWEIFVPPTLAYGSAGVPGSIPPDASLIFELQLVRIKGH